MDTSQLIRATLILTAVVASGAALAGVETFVGTCTRVVDGDTFVVEVDGRQVTVELAGVDAPELGQPLGKEVRAYLRKMLQGAELEVTVERRDGDQVVGRVSFGGEDLSRTLARQGLARVTGETADAAELEALSERARTARTGVWLRQAPAVAAVDLPEIS